MPFLDTGLSIDFNFEAMEGLIGNRGVQVVHEIAMPCTCMSVKSSEGAVGHAQPGCPKCYGMGYVYRDPVRMIGLITNLSYQKNMQQQGWVVPGDLSFSPSQNVREIADFDRITLTVPTPTDSQLIVRGEVSFATPRPNELKINEDLLLVEAGRPQAERIEDEDGREYHYGEYQLIGRKVVWTEGAGPAKGKKYVIRYQGYAEYIAWVTPMQRYDRARRLGQRVMMRKTKTDFSVDTRQVRPPWENRVEDSGTGDDPYYKTDSPNTFDPSR